MNSISGVLVYFDRDYMLLKPAAKLDILSTILLYLFRLCSSGELMDVIKKHLEWTGEQGIKFRALLKGNGEIQKSIKFFLYDRVINPTVPPLTEEYDIRPDDVIFVRKMLQLQSQNIRFLKAALRKANADGYVPRPMKVFNKTFIHCYQQLEVRCDKFISKKFRFLTQSGQMEVKNLRLDLMCSAVYAIYRAYPEIQNPTHMENIGIRTIHNRGVNILKEQTTKSRQRLTQNADGTFSGLLLSFSHAGFEASQNVDLTTGGNLSICNHLMTTIDGSSAAYERPHDVDRRNDLRRTVETISGKLNGPRPRTFVSLMMGEHHVKFSTWLGQPNDEACDSMPPREYAEKVRQFLKIDPVVARRFVIKLRESLRDFRN